MVGFLLKRKVRGLPKGSACKGQNCEFQPRIQNRLVPTLGVEVGVGRGTMVILLFFFFPKLLDLLG